MKAFRVPILMTSIAACVAMGNTAWAAKGDDPHLNDRVAIADLLARNIQANDSKNIDAYMKTYAKNPEFYTDQQNCVGPEAVKAFGQSMNCRNAPGGSSVPGSTPYMPGGAGGAPGAGAGAPGAAGAGGPPAGFTGAPPSGAGGPPAGFAGAPPSGAGGPPAGFGGGAAPGGAVPGGASGGAPGGRGGMTMQHIVCCSVVDFVDNNKATHRGYYYTVAGSNIVSVGHYEDVLIKEDGKWVIKSRRLAH